MTPIEWQLKGSIAVAKRRGYHDKRGLGGKAVEVVRAKAWSGYAHDATIATTTRRDTGT
jgi:hypothetical protein